MARARSARRAARGAGSAAGVALAIALAAVVGAATLLGGLWLALPDPAPLAGENPRTTALIEQRRAEARASRRPFRPRQIWVAPERISRVLVQAVLAAEDANFFGHEGIDWEAVRDAAEHDLRVRRFARGASTLTQQLAKNLWLGTEKSLWRKLKEAVLAAKLERALSKNRILALYLNVVELGDGVFGVEAGARERFGTTAAALTPAQAIVLASLLPAPRRADVAHPSRWLKARSRRLLDRLRDHGRLSEDAHRAASVELERTLAGPAPHDDRAEPPEDEEPRAAAGPRPQARLVSASGGDAAPPAADPEDPASDGAQNGADGTAGHAAVDPSEQGPDGHE